jgi:hypothetical protein
MIEELSNLFGMLFNIVATLGFIKKCFGSLLGDPKKKKK